MPAPTKGPRLGGSSAHQRHILSNLAAALFEHGRITTTEAKARRLRPVAERLITFAKRGDLHARRQVLTVVPDKGIVHSLFTEIGPGFSERDGGYTRITKIGPRKGDNAPMAVIELVRDEVTSRSRRRTRRSREETAAAPATTRAEETVSAAGGAETGQAAEGAGETAASAAAVTDGAEAAGTAEAARAGEAAEGEADAVEVAETGGEEPEASVGGEDKES